MQAFDKVIGYDSIKDELIQLCDMIRNREVYESMGARMPRGLLLYGEPGLGKTLMAKSFIRASGLPAYVVRRNKGDDGFIGGITETFLEAREHAPSVVFLDDLDKFANEDANHRDAEEYVAVQSGIDEVRDSAVFVIATANEMRKLPGSLTRSGRFDRKIEVQTPSERDAEAIIAHYLSDKKLSDQVDMTDLVKMISYSSCAELDTILNEAAIRAAFARKESIEKEDLIGAVLRTQYMAPDKFTQTSEEDRRRVALHEAGHVVVSETLCPGSIGLVSLRVAGRSNRGGFVHSCKRLPRRSDSALVAMAGKAAVELYCPDGAADGCQNDISRAAGIIREGLSSSATHGLALTDVTTDRNCGDSETLILRGEAVTHAELERCLLRARDILLRNRDFLERTAALLQEKETLLYSDIRMLREGAAHAVA